MSCFTISDPAGDSVLELALKLQSYQEYNGNNQASQKTMEVAAKALGMDWAGSVDFHENVRPGEMNNTSNTGFLGVSQVCGVPCH